MEENSALRRAQTNILENGYSVSRPTFYSFSKIIEKQEITLYYKNTESTENTQSEKQLDKKPNDIIREDNNPPHNKIDSHENFNFQKDEIQNILKTNESDKAQKKFSEIYNDEEISSKYRFLFVFKTQTLASGFLCGISLRFGIRLISLIFLAASLLKFFSVYQQGDLRRIITSALILLAFMIAACCMIYSSIYFNPYSAYIGLLIYTVIFYLYVVDDFLFISFVALGIVNPLGNNKSTVNIILLSLVIIATMLVHFYFLWICYSYWIHLRNENYALVKGDFYKNYEEYDSRNDIKNL